VTRAPSGPGQSTRRRALAALPLAFAALALGIPTRADERTWALLRAGGQVILMRHAQTTPGNGDPPGFRLGDCATQRNLSDRGRADARALGAALRERGIPVQVVLTSRWCRAIETARLAFGRQESWEELDSLYQDGSRRERQMAALRARVERFRGPGNLVLVGHGANILAATGILPRPGGLVVLTPGGPRGFKVAGALERNEVLELR
jgi:phosphohistidine phosphatase SixA